MTDNPFRPTAEERREGYTLVAELAASIVLGPIAPFAVFAARYLYDRRDAIFDRAGRPAQAFDVSGTAIPLTRTGNGDRLSVRPGLSASARGLGLRDGDPVGLILTGTTTRSGLVVPARIGERVDIAVPRGTYSLGAFAARRDQLFTRPHPFTAVDGRTVLAGGRDVLNLSPRIASDLKLSGGYRLRLCPRCGRLHPTTWPTCTAPTPAAPRATAPRLTTPRLTTPRQVVPRLVVPESNCWWCGLAESSCDCLLGQARRFWRGD